MPGDSGGTSGLKKRDLEVVCWSSEAWEYKRSCDVYLGLGSEAGLGWPPRGHRLRQSGRRAALQGEDHHGMSGSQAEREETNALRQMLLKAHGSPWVPFAGFGRRDGW